MRVVHRYELPIVGEAWIVLPRDAEVIHVDWRKTDITPQLWAVVDPNEPPTNRRFWLIPTGEFVDHGGGTLKPLGSVVDPINGWVIYHIFEIVDTVLD